jgi:hypothetical protein
MFTSGFYILLCYKIITNYQGIKDGLINLNSLLHFRFYFEISSKTGPIKPDFRSPRYLVGMVV